MAAAVLTFVSSMASDHVPQRLARGCYCHALVCMHRIHVGIDFPQEPHTNDLIVVLPLLTLISTHE